MKKYEKAIIDVSNFDLKDVVMASQEANDWYGDQPNGGIIDTNPISAGAEDIWSDLFAPNP